MAIILLTGIYIVFTSSYFTADLYAIGTLTQSSDSIVDTSFLIGENSIQGVACESGLSVKFVNFELAGFCFEMGLGAVVRSYSSKIKCFCDYATGDSRASLLLPDR